MSKHERFMKDIIVKYHPEFTASKDLQNYGLKYPQIFNIERLVEESLAAVGGYNFVDETGRDFDDPCNSDSKTVTVVNNSNTRESKMIIIANVHTKIGSLRVTVYNPYKDSVDFIYLPKSAVDYHKERDGAKTRESGDLQRIRTTWNHKKDHYNKLEDFRVTSFETLAKAMY